MPGGYRAIAAVKWTSLGIFPVVNRPLQSELVCKSFVPLCLDDGPPCATSAKGRKGRVVRNCLTDEGRRQERLSGNQRTRNLIVDPARMPLQARRKCKQRPARKKA